MMTIEQQFEALELYMKEYIEELYNHYTNLSTMREVYRLYGDLGLYHYNDLFYG